jgi:hypothetical protein
MVSAQLTRPEDLGVTHWPKQATQTRHNRTITVDIHDETTYFQLLDDRLGGSQQAFLTGPAHLYNLVPYQRRAMHAGQCGVEVEDGRVPHRRLVLQSADPHLRRLPMSGNTRYH